MTGERIVVGISGASGIPIGIETATAFATGEFEVHTVVSDAAKAVMTHETPDREAAMDTLQEVSEAVYDESDLAAPIASGSFETAGMVVVPASMNTVAGIATGLSRNLLGRAADVTLKEDRQLVVVPRESPMGEAHLENLLTLRKRGVSVVPPVLGFYFDPSDVDDMVDHVVGKILERFDVPHDRYDSWDGSG